MTMTSLGISRAALAAISAGGGPTLLEATGLGAGGMFGYGAVYRGLTYPRDLPRPVVVRHTVTGLAAMTAIGAAMAAGGWTLLDHVKDSP
jgi:hypothetical protein